MARISVRDQVADRVDERLPPRERAAAARRRMRAAAIEMDFKYIVRRRPWSAIGLALGAGFLMAYFPRLSRAVALGADMALRTLSGYARIQ